jgi:bacteriocin-like protein
MLMKYSDFKKMTANEMKEVKGGLTSFDPNGIQVKCGPNGTFFCVTANPEDCCSDYIVGGVCSTGAFPAYC